MQEATRSTFLDPPYPYLSCDNIQSNITKWKEGKGLYMYEYYYLGLA